MHSQLMLGKAITDHNCISTEGRWRVSIVTSELPAAATNSHVTITVYGAKGNTGPILLNEENNVTFKSGNEDQFAVCGLGVLKTYIKWELILWGPLRSHLDAKTSWKSPPNSLLGFKTCFFGLSEGIL